MIVVTWADNPPGSHHHRSAWVDFPHGTFAQHFELAVKAPCVFRTGLGERGERVVFIDTSHMVVSVDIRGRREDVVSHRVLQQLGRITNVARDVAGVVDHHVPLATPQRVELAVSISP